jgi:murein DD-endopeptidase MepM/ murein hydrolase activator NlpD
MAEPVTIGKQTFVKTAEGWVDKKTKASAPESLFNLLNSLTSESTGEYKKLRVRVDSSMPPVTLAGEEYVFDLNQSKWINKKTRDAVNDTLQKIINGVLEKLEAEKASSAPAITTAMGTIGQAAKSTVKKSDGTKMPVNIKINSPIVAMIEKLATIDGYLKQRLDNQKKIAARNVAMTRETAIEAKKVDAVPVQEVKKEDAEKSNAGSIAAALVVGGLIAAQFEPVRDAFTSLVEGVKGVWNFASNIAKTMADGLDFFNGTSSTSSSSASSVSSSTSPAALSSATPLDPSTPNVVQNPSEGVPSEPNRADASPIAPSQPNEAAPTQVSSGGSTTLGRTLVGAAIGGAIGGKAGALVGGAIGFLSAPADEGAPNYSPTSSSPSSSQPSSGNNATGVERVGAPSGGPMGDFAANFKDPVPNGRWSGPGLGQSRAGGTRRHQGMDIFAPMGTPVYATADGEVVYSERRSGDGGSAGFGMAVQLKHADGYTTKYAHLSKLKGYSKGDRVNAGDVIGYVGDTGNAKGTPPHLHFEIWKGRQMQEPANFLSGANRTGYAADDGSGTGDNLMGMAQNATSQLWDLGTAAIEAIGSIIQAGVGPQVLRPITDSLVSSAPSIAPEIAAASTMRIGAIAESRTQSRATTPSLPDPPNLNAGNGNLAIENLPSSSDRAGVEHYLTRMGFPKIEYHVPVQQTRMA